MTSRNCTDTRERGTTRREWFGSVARWCGLAAIVGGGAWLLRRGRSPGRGDALIGFRIPCGRCGAFLDCRLPLAESARRQGIGIVTPVRGVAPGRGAEAEPLCPEGRDIARAESEKKEADLR